jgi:hypothetical protein
MQPPANPPCRFPAPMCLAGWACVGMMIVAGMTRANPASPDKPVELTDAESIQTRDDYLAALEQAKSTYEAAAGTLRDAFVEQLDRQRRQLAQRAALAEVVKLDAAITYLREQPHEPPPDGVFEFTDPRSRSFATSYQQRMNQAATTYLQTVAFARRRAVGAMTLHQRRLGRVGEVDEALNLHTVTQRIAAEWTPLEERLIPRRVHESPQRAFAGHPSNDAFYRFTLPEYREARLGYLVGVSRATYSSGVIFLIRPDGSEVQVGNWTPFQGIPSVPDTRNTFQRSDSDRLAKRLYVDISDALAGPGEYRVRFQNVSGFSALVIYAVGIEAR